jgi:hypothetical protein
MPIWLYISIAGPGLLIAGLGVWLNYKRKEITYEIFDKSPLIKWSDDIRGKLKLSFMGMNVEDAHSIVVQIKNTGNQAIAAKDFAQPFILLFGKDAEVLTYDVVQKTPDNLKLDLSIGLGSENATSLQIESFLLNKGESFILKALVSKFSGEVTIDARIADVKIKNPEALSFWQDTVLPWLICLPFSFALAVCVQYIFDRRWKYMISLIMLFTVIYSTLLPYRYYKYNKKLSRG